MEFELYNDIEIRIIRREDNIWFCGKNAAQILGYKNTERAIRNHVNDNQKCVLKTIMTPKYTKNHTRNQLNAIYINTKGFIEFLSNTKMPNVIDVIKWFNNTFDIDFQLVKRLDKEQEHIKYIMDTFKHLDYRTQYKMDIYRVDLYFPNEKIAIECDEFNHKDRCPDYERTREEYIKKELQCKFVRFNPDEPNFSIFDVLNQIVIQLTSR
jgi:very-short-patch-repair endonuclease